MKIQTTNLDKGGGGKSSHTYNEGDWLSRIKNKRVLLIDGARECNLTHSFDVTSEKTIYDIFTTGEYEICRINDNLSLIRGDERLTDEQLDLASRNNKYLQLFMWFSEHYEELAEQFDISARIMKSELGENYIYYQNAKRIAETSGIQARMEHDIVIK